MTVPNALSLARVPLGALVGWLAVESHWSAAFAVLAVGCLTDVLDGYLAQRLNQKSRLGADVLEPVCDLALTAGALAGLLFSNHLSWWLLGGLVAVAVPVQIINSFLVPTVLFTHFGKWFMPLYFLGAIVALLVTYTALAFTGSTVGILLLAELVVVSGLVYTKRQRFAAWFNPAELNVALA